MVSPIGINHDPNTVRNHQRNKICVDTEHRKEKLRSEISEKLREAKALGDLSENTEYQEAINIQSFNEGRITELEVLTKNSLLIEEDGHKHLEVEVGATVTVSSKHGEQTFTIVGPSESNPMEGFISNESPLGRAFLGKIAGEATEVVTPKGKTKYKIVKIT